MSERNKILSKYCAPYRIIGASMFAIAATIIGMNIYNNTDANIFSNNGYSTKQNGFNCVLGILLVTICAFFGYFSMIKTPNDAYKEAFRITKKYLDYVAQTHPEEAAKIKEIIKDKEAIKRLCAFISNSLTKEDRSKILKIVGQLDSVQQKSDEDAAKLFKNLESSVLDILKQREVLDNNFTQNIIQNGIPYALTKDDFQR